MRVVKYFFVGGMSAVVDFTIFVIFAKLLHYNYLMVGAAGFLVATLVNYSLSIRFVFVSGARFSKKKEMFAVYLVSTVGLLIHLAALHTAVDVFGIELILAKINATAIVFLWNYLIRHYFVFSEKTVKDSVG